MPTIKCIDTAVRAAKFAGTGTATEFRVEGNPGLVFVIHKPSTDGHATRCWRYHYSFVSAGKQVKRRVPLGAYPAVTLAEARRKAAELAERVEREGDVVTVDRAAAVVKERQSLTFSDLMTEYLCERATLVTHAEIARELRKDAIPALGQKRPAEITAADIDHVARSIVERGSKAMASRQVEHIKALYNYCLLDRPALAERYGITYNPVALLGRRRRGAHGAYSKPAPRQRFLTDLEIAAFWPTLYASGMRPSTRLALLLILVTAQRPGEVRRSRWRDLHLSDSQPFWTIPAEHAKNGREHVVPLSPLAVRLFRDARKLSGSNQFNFPDPNSPTRPVPNVVLPTALANFFKRDLPDSEPCTAHDLRRTAATGMRRLGISRDDVSLVLNHASAGVTAKHYDHHQGETEKRVALEKWAEHLLRTTAENGLLAA